MLYAHRHILSLAVTFLIASCRTTSPESAPDAAAQRDALNPVLTFPKETERALYLKMLAVELENGAQVPKDQLHGAQGIIECRKDGILETCLLRVRLDDGSLSGPQPLDDQISKLAWTYIRAARDELKDERIVITDLACDYIGKRSPPFDHEDVTCKGQGPRVLSETLFVDPVAEEIVQAIRGQAAFGQETVILNGAVSCRTIASSGRTPCTVRAMAGEVLEEKVTELSQQASAPVARKLLQAFLDQAAYDAAAEAPAPAAPRELMASLTCIVDNHAYEQEGARRHICRARM